MTQLGWLSRVARVLRAAPHVAAVAWHGLGDVKVRFTDASAIQLRPRQLRLVRPGSGAMEPARLFADRMKTEAETDGEALYIDPALLPRPTPRPTPPERRQEADLTVHRASILPAYLPAVQPAPPVPGDAAQGADPTTDPDPDPAESQDDYAPGF